ncbi:hypothetical protein C8J57DRAFT_1655412 [Mycena rebaudengoi]|nr:hypothetical protein C8J57DRAFT_1655412 [Mycena rebaudengoi]
MRMDARAWAPRKNCIFYVNQRDVDMDDPNYAKNRAIQFADLINAANPGGDYHTLYDVYDSAAAFTYTDNPMASAFADGHLQHCSGHLYLIVDAEPQEVTEIRPEDVGAVADNGRTRFIRHHPCRGGQPPGATPPRDGEKSEIDSCISIDRNVSNQKLAKVVDVSGDFPPFDQGGCTMHVHEYFNANAGGGPFGDPHYQATYSVEVTLYDDEAAHKIGFMARTDAPYNMKSKLDALFVVTPVGSGDYIHFSLGTQTFKSNDGSCSVGGWDRGRDRQMDCGFPCTWGGGDSTNRSPLGLYMA